MHALLGVSSSWLDPPPTLRRGGALLLGVLLVEGAAWCVRRAAPLDPTLLLGIARTAEAALLLGLGPWSLRSLMDREAVTRSLILTSALSAAGMAGLLVWAKVLHLPVYGLPRPGFSPAAGWGVFLLTACLASPVAEELVFRGLIHRSLRTRLSAPITTGAVSGGFALLHAAFGGSFLVPLAGSVVFCAGYEKEKTLWAPVLLHVFGNAVLFLSPFWMYG